ncbi:MAG: tetratricopeptide (TPR) repeat protein [Bermanella sp.]|jgi:tetratricopeptide (TPR) repeat protein
MRRLLIVSCLLLPLLASANTVKDLKYGTILFDYYQQNYFAALIGYEYAKATNELKQNAEEARLLQGGMTLSYGLPDHAQVIFNDLLNGNVDEATANKAWYFLAKLYYQKGEVDAAARNLERIQGHVPDDIAEEFNYLATLINIRNMHLETVENSLSKMAKNSAYEPYLIFNLAITQLRNNQIENSKRNLKKVIDYAQVHKDEEFAVLADRAKQALSHIEVENGNLLGAWQHLQNVRTTGLYSNRALLSYGWTAIKLKRFSQAVPALKALDRRSISIAEVQEAKVLLAHLYEQQGASRSALKQYLLAEKAFASGVDSIAKARKVIAGQRIPEEFVVNLEAMMDETDWYGSEPSLDYNKLTPFLIELMSSNSFHSVIKELRDLYALRNNLTYWGRQALEHQLIIQYRQQGLTSKSIGEFVFKAQAQQEQLENEISDLRLHTMTLDVEEQERFTALLESTDQSFTFLEDKLSKIQSIKEPYRQSEENVRWAKKLHNRIKQKLAVTDGLIDKLEHVMRIVVNAELDNHEERMRYYWAQARLGKARLYDQTLNNIEDDRMRNTGEQP